MTDDVITSLMYYKLFFLNKINCKVDLISFCVDVLFTIIFLLLKGVNFSNINLTMQLYIG